jgi:hypothetical protein
MLQDQTGIALLTRVETDKFPNHNRFLNIITAELMKREALTNTHLQLLRILKDAIVITI